MLQQSFIGKVNHETITFPVRCRHNSGWSHPSSNYLANDPHHRLAFKRRLQTRIKSHPHEYHPVFHLSEKNGNYGATFGFVDDKMSLLALERDSLKAAEALKWKDAGVPPLLADEIIINPADKPVLPVDNAIFENTRVAKALQDATKTFSINLLGNNRIAIEFGKNPDGKVTIMLMDLRGRLVYKLENMGVSGHSLTVSLPAALKGVYLMRVIAGKESYRKKFILR
jgi:hypothetical protein